jgi:hypothetical protein
LACLISSYNRTYMPIYPERVFVTNFALHGTWRHMFGHSVCYQRRIVWGVLGRVRLGYGVLGSATLVRFPFTSVYLNLVPVTSV